MRGRVNAEHVGERVRRSWPDVVLGTGALALGLPSLLYPFGRDQGLYYYVAREWVLRGQIPYRDVLDHKTPGIYILHAVAVMLFGEVQWGIRVLDVLGVLTFGAVAGSLFEPAGRPLPRGMRGATALLLAMLFYGYLDFWNTAQSELWYAGLATCSVWAAWRHRTLHRAALLAGLFAGAALIMKPPAMPMLLVAVAALLVRARRSAVLRTSALPLGFRYAAGASIVPVLVLGYFAAHGALPAMRDIVIGANAYYVKHEPGAPPGFDWRDFAGTILSYYAPFTGIFPVGIAAAVVWARLRHDSRVMDRVLMASALLATSVLSVVMQAKFYLLHWAVCLVPLAFFGLVALASLRFALAPKLAWVAAGAMTVLGYVSTAWIPHAGAARWQLEVVRAERKFLAGELSRESFNEYFQIPVLGFNYATSYRVGVWLRNHTQPDDIVSVRGFQPEIYAVAQRRHVGRFFWTLFLTSPYRAYKRAEWLAEDERDLREHPPKYIAATTHAHEGPESVEWLARFGYRPVHVDGVFTIVERGN